jgi:hypothetical protein
MFEVEEAALAQGASIKGYRPNAENLEGELMRGNIAPANGRRPAGNHSGLIPAPSEHAAPAPYQLNGPSI